jgi:hypothetical protein
MPSALPFVLFAYGVRARWGIRSARGWLYGLEVVAVAQAVLGLMRALAPDRDRATLAVATVGGSRCACRDVPRCGEWWWRWQWLEQ